MRDLAHQRCFNHAAREAVARCLECTKFFCRECITEHDDRILCTACLKTVARTTGKQTRAFGRMIRFVQCVVGVLVAWFFFFLIADILAQLPDSFHEGNLWRTRWIDQK
jgi:hypothetical protein